MFVKRPKRYLQHSPKSLERYSFILLAYDHTIVLSISRIHKFSEFFNTEFFRSYLYLFGIVLRYPGNKIHWTIGFYIRHYGIQKKKFAYYNTDTAYYYLMINIYVVIKDNFVFSYFESTG